MADHGHVEYATAEGNDLPAHEQTYERFVHLAFVGSCHVANIVIGLAIGAHRATGSSPSRSSSSPPWWRCTA